VRTHWTMRSGLPLLSFRRVVQRDLARLIQMRAGAFFMSKHRLTLATLVALLAAGALLVAGCGGGTISPDAVAVVDGKKISRGDLDMLLLQAKSSYKKQTPPQTFPQAGTSQYQALQQQAVVYLVRQEEFLQQAKTYNIVITDADIDKLTATLVKQTYGGDRKKLEAEIKKQGSTMTEFRQSARSQELQNKLIAAITKGIAVTPADAKAYYDKNKASSAYTTPESRLMRHILVKDLAKANAIYAQLQAGADFAKLEKKNSLDTGTNQQGGTLNVTKGQTVPEYESVAFKLKTGTISKPVHSKQYGYFIIKPVGDLKQAATKSFDKVSKEITATLLDTKKNEALTAWSKNLVKIYASKVKYATGFAPPAAATTPSTTTG
jgi:parvulin-like peptidyl-prolyl isomerase